MPFNVHGILLPGFFEIHEEECTVLDDGPAHREAVLVAEMIGLFATVEKIACIECRPLSVPPSAAVELVGALLQHDVDDRPSVVAELCREAVVLELELLHDLHRRLVVHIGVTAFTLLRRAEGTAVDADLRGRVALAIGHEVGA